MSQDHSFAAKETEERLCVVSTARHQVTATWNGISYVFNPGELDGVNSCIKPLPPDIARRVQYNRRKFLEIMKESAGKALWKLGHQEGSFFKAYKKGFGAEYGAKATAGVEATRKAKARKRLAEECSINLTDDEYAEMHSEDIIHLINFPEDYHSPKVEAIMREIEEEQKSAEEEVDVSEMQTIAQKKAYRKALWDRSKELDLNLPKNIPTKDLEIQVNTAEEVQAAAEE